MSKRHTMKIDELKDNLLRELIKEELLSERLRDARFDLAKFKTLDQEEALVYCHMYLEPLGFGSSRGVFRYSSSKAIKVALNVKGIAQNEEEMSVFTNPNTVEIVAKIFDYDKDYNWLFSELVRPLSSDGEFFKLIDMTDSDVIKICGHKKFYSFMTELVYNNTNVADFQRKVNDYNNLLSDKAFDFVTSVWCIVDDGLLVGDLEDIKHFGKTTNGDVVILDYGYTKKSRKFYFSDDSHDEDEGSESVFDQSTSEFGSEHI